jgi:hypothetical protein
MRRLFQFRLRTLFLLTALAAFLAWLLPPQIEKYREYRARLERERLIAEIDRVITLRLSNITFPIVDPGVLQDREDLQIEYIDGGFFADLDLVHLEWITEEERAKLLQRSADDFSHSGSVDNEADRPQE